MTPSAETSLCRSITFLRLIIDKSVELHQGRTPENRVTLGILRDYFTWLAVDALTDERLARHLVNTIARLQEELRADAEYNRAQDVDPTAPTYYEGFLHGLEQAISFRYGVDLLLEEEISRGEFLESWERTRERLGL